MFWTIVIIVAVIILYNFFTSLNKDNNDLQHQSLADKFQIIINNVNDYAFNGRGEVIILDKRSFNIYQEGQNQIVNFLYSTGHLTITWKYKYFQKELVHERQFRDVRNLSIFEQQKIAEILIKEMASKVDNHKRLVLKDISPPQIPIQQSQLLAIRDNIESQLRDLLIKSFKDAQPLPEMMHGIIIMKAAGNFSQNLKNSYPEMKQEIENLNHDFLSESDFNEMIDEITTKVLGEFIELPPK